MIIAFAVQSDFATVRRSPVTHHAITDGLRSAAVSDDSSSRAAQPSQARMLEAYGKLPLNFELNQGQTDRRVKFLSRGSGYSLFLTGDEAVLTLRKGSPPSKLGNEHVSHQLAKGGLQRASFVAAHAKRHSPKTTQAVLRMRLVGVNERAKTTGLEQLPGKSNYFIGNDPKKWRSNVPNYAKVKCANVYPGVDLLYHGNQRQLEYDFVVQPGADPRQIELSFDGAKRLRLDAHGDLIVDITRGEVIEHKPIIYQDIGGMRRQVAGSYELRNGHTAGFKLAGYDAHQSLTIDPSLGYSTYLGGSNSDLGAGIAVDSAGNAYITGITSSSNFPTTAGAFQSTVGGGSFDAFVSKLNSSGSALMYSTYLGGSNYDAGNEIALDSAGNAYVTGNTFSNDFPTTAGAFQTTFSGGSYDAFVSKLNSSGSTLVYSTYLGGSDSDGAGGIAVDSSGNAYVTGLTRSTNFPTTAGAFQTTYGGGENAFISKLNSSGSAPVYSPTSAAPAKM
jgi:hypothetical protein